MNEEIYNKCFMVESDKQDRNENSFRAIRLDDLFKITDKYNSADNLEKENTKLKQEKEELIDMLKKRIDKVKMFKNLSDKDKKEVLSLMSFMKKFKEQERKKELYATYEEYLDLIHISEHLNDENESLQSQLDIANKKLDKIKEYCETIKEKYKFFHESNTIDVSAILEIIGDE